MRVKIIVESMPRCGTHYLIRNLMQSFDYGYCTIYPAAKREGQVKREEVISGQHFNFTYDAGGTWYAADGGKNIVSAKENYVCKTHFSAPLPEESEAVKIYLWGDVLDYVYLSTRMWAEQTRNPDFKVTSSNQVFKIRVGQYFGKLEQWLERVVPKPNAVRYEDMLFKQREVIQKLEELFGYALLKWEPPKLLKHRLIFNDWRPYIEEGIGSHIVKRFKKYLWSGYERPL